MALGSLSDPKSNFERLLGGIKGTIIFTFLFSTLLTLNLVQTASLFVRYFSQTSFRRINRWLAGLWWGWCAVIAEKLNRVQFEINGDDLPAGENAIVLLNHQSMSDIAVIFTLARMKARIGDLKWFVKDTLKYVPGIGWGMLFLDCLFVRRNWTADRDYIYHVFGNILKYEVPLWLMTFVEGTRITPSKIVGSQKYAQKKGLKPLGHVLIPRTKGFVASVQALRGHADAVYDITVGYVDGVPTLWQWIKGFVRCVHLNVRRFPIDEIPEEGELLAAWLRRRFEEKDVLLENYYHNGIFTSLVPPE